MHLCRRPRKHFVREPKRTKRETKKMTKLVTMQTTPKARTRSQQPRKNCKKQSQKSDVKRMRSVNGNTTKNYHQLQVLFAGEHNKNTIFICTHFSQLHPLQCPPEQQLNIALGINYMESIDCFAYPLTASAFFPQKDKYTHTNPKGNSQAKKKSDPLTKARHTDSRATSQKCVLVGF